MALEEQMPDHPSAGNDESLIFETILIDDSMWFLEVDAISAIAELLLFFFGLFVKLCVCLET